MYWKIRFKTQVSSCSDFPSHAAMLWIKEVVMVDSVDDLKSSRSSTGTHFPNFGLLDARIASALNKIIPSSKKEGQLRGAENPQRGSVSLEEDRLPS